jgi:hypothetical protein
MSRDITRTSRAPSLRAFSFRHSFFSQPLPAAFHYGKRHLPVPFYRLKKQTVLNTFSHSLYSLPNARACARYLI